MQKPFTITHAMREEAADTLTLQAVAQHGPRIADDLSALNDQFWTKHRTACEALPGLSKKHWTDLIQVGALTATATCFPTYEKQRGEDRSPVVSYFIAAERQYKNERRNDLVDKLLASSAFEGVKRFLAKNCRYESDWKIHLVSRTGAVPRLNGMEHIADPVLESLALLICTDLEAVIKAALSFRSQAMDVLLACRTSRQVEDLFPEAAKLLPQPVKADKALAPTELAANVRNMLSKGVPPLLAQA